MNKTADFGCPAARPLEYADYVAALRAEHPKLAEEFVNCHGIEPVLQWMQKRGLISAAIDMVAQDEFNYDFLIELEPGGRWLAFGVT